MSAQERPCHNVTVPPEDEAVRHDIFGDMADHHPDHQVANDQER
ncbi:MAG TPA: hypothetical protein VGW38_28070 [Chloroflexota bacterium]|nr:hypothetical protein [Chloroflexota bacterium]